MKKVSNILARKGNSVIAIDGGTTVLDALKLMADKNIGSVVITAYRTRLCPQGYITGKIIT
jgi:predicted transcriptional regulator